MHAGIGRRVIALYLQSRRLIHSLAALAAIVVLVWWIGQAVDPVTVEDPMLIPRNQTLAVHLAAALLASVIGVGLWTPFGETERVSSTVLPAMRAMHLVLLVAIGVAGVVLVIRMWPYAMPGIDLSRLLIRNVLFLTGCVVLAGKVVDVRLAWLVPMLLSGVTAVAILQRVQVMESPAELWRLEAWNVLAQDQANGVANAVCIGVAVGAFATYIRDGVRDTDDAE